MKIIDILDVIKFTWIIYLGWNIFCAHAQHNWYRELNYNSFTVCI